MTYALCGSADALQPGRRRRDLAGEAGGVAAGEPRGDSSDRPVIVAHRSPTCGRRRSPRPSLRAAHRARRTGRARRRRGRCRSPSADHRSRVRVEVDAVHPHLLGPHPRHLGARRPAGRASCAPPPSTPRQAGSRPPRRTGRRPRRSRRGGRPAAGRRSPRCPRCASSREGYIGVSTPVRAQVSRLPSASALRARWATTCARVQSGNRDGAARSSSVRPLHQAGHDALAVSPPAARRLRFRAHAASPSGETTGGRDPWASRIASAGDLAFPWRAADRPHAVPELAGPACPASATSWARTYSCSDCPRARHARPARPASPRARRGWSSRPACTILAAANTVRRMPVIGPRRTPQHELGRDPSSVADLDALCPSPGTDRRRRRRGRRHRPARAPWTPRDPPSTHRRSSSARHAPSQR